MNEEYAFGNFPMSLELVKNIYAVLHKNIDFAKVFLDCMTLRYCTKEEADNIMKEIQLEDISSWENELDIKIDTTEIGDVAVVDLAGEDTGFN